MFTQFLKLITIIGLSAFLTACGGGSSGGSSNAVNSSTPVTAYFIDAPVSGASYKTESKNGTTGTNGEFSYNDSDKSVTFSVGKITLGTIKIANIQSDLKLFIQDLVGVSRDTVDNTDVLKIASLLQSLDTATNSNGITLDANDLDKFPENKNIKDINVSRQLAFAGKTLKDIDTVKEHLGDTIRKNGIAPNLTYTPTAGYSGTDSFTFKVNDGTVDSSVVTVNISVNATTVVSSSIKKTGQTKSYDANGVEVTDGSLKDDGYYQRGVSPRYTRASDMVTDELTGLMWQDDAAAASTQKQWLTTVNYTTCSNDTSSPACYDTSGDTAASQCTALSLGGYTDWRLPTSTELERIVDYSKVGSTIDSIYFNNISSNRYWSASTYEGGKYYAWGVYFNYGGVSSYYKGSNGYVRCVRDGQ